MTKFDHFNFLGPFYDLIFGEKRGGKLLELAEMKPGLKLLDVGGGTGRVAVLFKDESSNLVIADSALKMLQKAKEKGIQSVYSESERLPFENEAFDRIIMVDALHHVADQRKTINEMWRLLAPMGRIVIEEPDIQNLVVKLLAVGEKLLLMRSHFLSPKSIANLFQKNKANNVRIDRKKGIAWITITKLK